jgi:hypothetical protein
MTETEPGATLYSWASKHQPEAAEYLVLRRAATRAVVRLANNEHAEELTVDLVEGRFVPDTGESLYATPENPFGRAVAHARLRRGLLDGREVSEPGQFVVVNPHTGERPYSSDQETLARAAADRLTEEIRHARGEDAAPAEVYAHEGDAWVRTGTTVPPQAPEPLTDDPPTVEDVITERRLAALARLEEAARTVSAAIAALESPQGTDLGRCLAAAEAVAELRRHAEATTRLLDGVEDLGRLFGLS